MHVCQSDCQKNWLIREDSEPPLEPPPAGAVFNKDKLGKAIIISHFVSPSSTSLTKENSASLERVAMTAGETVQM